MKHLLFIVYALTGSFSAHARYSPADCRESLVAHLWTEQKFSPVKKLDGALDGLSTATLLVRLKGPAKELVLPSWRQKITGFSEQTFTRDGATYALIHGEAGELAEARHEIALLNYPRKVSFQVLDKSSGEPVPPKLGRELERRVSLFSYLKKPFVKVDEWLTRFKVYRGFKGYMAKETRPLRDGLAARLHRGRHPETKVSEYVLSEVRSCTDPACVLEPAPVDLIQQELEKLSAAVGLNIKLDHAGSLTPLTVDLLSLLNPLDLEAHENAAREAELGDWDLRALTRYQRGVFLTRALKLIEAGLDPAATDRPARRVLYTPEEVTAIAARFKAHIATPLSTRVATTEEWQQEGLRKELFDPAFHAIRSRRPFVAIEVAMGDGAGAEATVKIVAFDPDHVSTGGDVSLVDQIANAGQGRISSKVLAAINGPVQFRKLTPEQIRDPAVLKDLIDTQDVAIVPAGEYGHRILFVPMSTGDGFAFDPSVPESARAGIESAGDLLKDKSLLSDPITTADGALRYVRTNQMYPGDLMFDLRLSKGAGGREQRVVSNLRRLNVEVGSVVDADVPVKAMAALASSAHARAPEVAGGLKRLPIDEVGGDRAWYFDFSYEAFENEDHVKISKIRMVQKKSAQKLWKKVGQTLGVTGFEYQSTPDNFIFSFGTDQVTRVEMSDLVTARTAVLFEIGEDEIRDVLDRTRGLVVDTASMCASVQHLDICFGNQGGSWARITDVKRNAGYSPMGTL